MSANKIQTLNETQLNFSQGFQTVQLINGKSDFQIDISRLEITGGSEIPEELLPKWFIERRKSQKSKPQKPTLSNINVLYKRKPFNVLVKKISKFDNYGHSEKEIPFKYKIKVQIPSSEQNLDKLTIFQRFIQLGIQFKLFQVIFDIKNINSDREFLEEFRYKIGQPVDIEKHYGRFLKILENQEIIRKPSKMTRKESSHKAPKIKIIETVQDFYLDVINQVSEACEQLDENKLSKEQRKLKIYFSMECFCNPMKKPYGCVDTISFEEVKYIKNGTPVTFDQYVWTMIFKVFTPKLKEELQKNLLESNMKSFSKDDIKQAFTENGYAQMFKILITAINEKVRLPPDVFYLTSKKLTDNTAKFFELSDFEIEEGSTRSVDQIRYFVLSPEMSCIAGAMNSHHLTWIVKEVKFVPLPPKENRMNSAFSTSYIPNEDENFEDRTDTFEAESILDDQF